MLKKLFEQRSAALARCNEISTLRATRELTAEERSEFDGLLVKLRQLTTDIASQEELDRITGEQAQAEARSATAAAAAAAEPNRYEQQQQRGALNVAGTTVHENAEDEPFSSVAQQLRSVMDCANSKGRTYDPRLRKFDMADVKVRAASGMSESVGSEGGFLVGTQQGALIEKQAFETGILAPETQIIELDADKNGVEMPYIDETSRATGSRWGGIRGYWMNEATPFTASKPSFGKFKLGLNKFGVLVYLTDELLQDQSATGSIISSAVGEEIAFSLDDAIINGTGAGVPQGILNAPCLVTVSKESSQAAATILYANVSKMRTRMTPRMYAGANWYINAECMPQIEQLNIPIKNVAGAENVGGMPVFVNGNASNTPYGTMFGRPIVPIEHAAALGTVGDIMLLNLKWYLMARKGGVQSASSIHVNFLTDEQVFRFIVRADGRSPLKAAITPYKGSATLSPFVVLQAR